MLFQLSEKEQVSLYEAALIRYFMPKYNLSSRTASLRLLLKILKKMLPKRFLSNIGIDMVR